MIFILPHRKIYSGGIQIHVSPKRKYGWRFTARFTYASRVGLFTYASRVGLVIFVDFWKNISISRFSFTCPWLRWFFTEALWWCELSKIEHFWFSKMNNHLSTTYPVWLFGCFFCMFAKFIFLKTMWFASHPGGNEIDGLPTKDPERVKVPKLNRLKFPR